MAPSYALLSVSDKSGLIPFAKELQRLGLSLLSTGGTARALRDAGLEVTEVAEMTGFPEILDGRVKTLHPRIHGAILARRDRESHRSVLREHKIPDISLVVVNLYPFRETVARDGATFDDAIENIDIGGPTLLRAAAKNHGSVTVVVDPQDFGRVTSALQEGLVPPELRRELALKAFRHTATYDAAIVGYLERSDERRVGHALPRDLVLGLGRDQTLRYGENPHQPAALYSASGEEPFGGVRQLHGKALSYNNLIDLDAALALTREFSQPACAIIKHTNPAGCAAAESPQAAYDQALACDPMSAFGGIVSLTRPVSGALAQKLNAHFFEIVAAPGFDEDALEILMTKKNRRICVTPSSLELPRRLIRATSLGYLVQHQDPVAELNRDRVEVPTQRQPSEQEWAGMEFLWKVCKHVKSNAIVLGQQTRTSGIGAGQMSRVDAVELAIHKAQDDLRGAILASDAFFPFRDGVDAAARAGIRAVVQPGGSRRDAEVVAACDEYDIAMVFTGQRHFRH